MSTDLVATHTRQIALHAHRLTARLPRCAEVEDLEQVGWETLLRCQVRYHASPATLHTYADRRIRGAMHDELRRLDPRTRYAQQHGTAPCTFVPLSDARPQATPAPTPEPWLAALVARMPARQQQVLQLSYVEGWRLHEIGALWGCTESYVSQVRTQALARLRRMLKEKGDRELGSREDGDPSALSPLSPQSLLPIPSPEEPP